MLEDAIDTLPGAFRAVFVLRVVEGMSVAETAEALDVPEETIKTRLFRARAVLKDALATRADAVAPRAFEFHVLLALRPRGRSRPSNQDRRYRRPLEETR